MRGTMRTSLERGSALVVTLLALGALTILGLGTIALSGMDGEIAINQRSGDQALYVAEAGVRYGSAQAALNPALATGATLNVRINDGSADVAFKGVGNTTDMNIVIGPAPGATGNAVVCGIPGYSDKFGSMQFQVVSTGKGPSGASRQMQAIMLLPPVEGLCPPSGGTVFTYPN